jgi:hypothetical protein
MLPLEKGTKKDDYARRKAAKTNSGTAVGRIEPNIPTFRSEYD